MKVKWFAHASFLLEGDGLRIITDPYTPEKSGFATITEPADIVIRSSDNDSAHANADMITGDPEVVTATHILEDGALVKGLEITAIPAKESMMHKLEPRDNAMYRFTLDGVDILHFGDVGNSLTEDQLSMMAGADVVMVPTSGPPTIELEDLYQALDHLQPRIIIPMHYKLPGCKFPIDLDAKDFASHYPDDRVVWVEESEVELTPETLPAEPRVMVMKTTTAG